MSEPKRQENIIAFPTQARVAILRDLIDGYRGYLRGEGRREQGIARYVWALGRFETWLSERLNRPAILADLTAEVVRAYKVALAEAGRKNATIINALATVRDFALFAQIPDPTAGVRRPPKRRPNPRPLYPEEIVALMQIVRAIPDDLNVHRRWIWQRNQRLLSLYLYTGVRLAEATNLRWSEVHLDSGIIEVRDGKNGNDRIVPIAAPLLELLRAVPEAERQPHMAVISKRHGDGTLEPMSRRGVEKVTQLWLRQLLKAAEKDQHLRVYAHRLRATFASVLLWNGVDLKTIQELMGHLDLATTQYYLDVRDDDKRAAVDKFPRF
ncbi:MAG: tyrosine recombinase XerA [Roseiflexaceae bacterium]